MEDHGINSLTMDGVRKPYRAFEQLERYLYRLHQPLNAEYLNDDAFDDREEMPRRKGDLGVEEFRSIAQRLNRYASKLLGVVEIAKKQGIERYTTDGHRKFPFARREVLSYAADAETALTNYESLE